MEQNSSNSAKNILEKFGAKPNKRLGQNFLIDKNILQKIIDSSNIKPDDIILEVGPGVGTLTQELAKRAQKVIAVEKDKAMCKILEESLKAFKNIEIVSADILNFEIKEKYKVVANIPYYLTSPLIRKFLEEKNPPQEIILMIQKEVAQRICSTPPNMSLLAVSVQFYATPKILFNVSKNSFWPIPRVDSAVIKITPHARHCEPDCAGRRRRESRKFRDLFFKIVKAGFSQPRKQLAGNLSKSLKNLPAGRQVKKEEAEKWLLQNNIQPTQRAETLTVQDWQNLTLSL